MGLRVLARVSLGALVLFGMQGFPPGLAPSGVAAQEETVCADTDIDYAIWEVHERAPNGQGTQGECDPKRYGGQWSSYEELVEKVRAAGAGAPAAPAPPPAPPASAPPPPPAPGTAPTLPPDPPAAAYKDGECKDWRIGNTIIGLMKRMPKGKGEEGECDPKKYGVTPEMSLQDVEAKYRAANQGVCSGDELTRAIRDELGRPAQGIGWEGECDPSRYDRNGYALSYETLRFRIRVVREGAVLLDPKGEYPYAHSTPRGDFQRRVFELVNEERKKAGLPALGYHACLEQVAQDHSESMAKNGYFDHFDQVNKTYPQDRADAYRWLGSMAENIAGGSPTPEAVMPAWMNSPGHKANILSPNSKEMGVGYVSTPNHYWTQTFSTKWGTNAKCG